LDQKENHMTIFIASLSGARFLPKELPRGAAWAAWVLIMLSALLGGRSDAQELSTLANFNGDNGKNPFGNLTLSGSTLYGTTLSGGANGDGAIFSIPVGGSVITTVASLNNTNGNGIDGGLTLVGSTLYGTAEGGGNSIGGYGTVFSVPLSGGSPTVLCSFSGTGGTCPGSCPFGSVTPGGSTLYGTTYQGGASNDGTVFSLPIGGGAPKTLATFNGANGSSPYGALLLSGSMLYGTTYYGGAYNDGTIFSVPVTGGPLTTLATFNGSNGQGPCVYGSLLLCGSTLYGTASLNGPGNEGTLFSLPITGGSLTTLLAFNGSNGADPMGNLTLSGSTIYGMTFYGGTYGEGTLFSIHVGGSGLTSLYSFNGINSQNPVGGVTVVGSALYGTTAYGGSFGDGTVFCYLPTLPNLPERTWNVDARGNWSNAANWDNGSANGTNAQVTFGAAITAARTVSVDVAVAAGALTFNNASRYTIAGPQAITLQASPVDATIHVAEGSHTISAPLILASATDVIVDNAGDTLTLSGNVSGAGMPLTKYGDGTLVVSGSNTFSGGATVLAGILQLGSQWGVPDNAPLTVNGGTLDLGGFTKTTSAAVSFVWGVTQDGAIVNNGSPFVAQSGTVSASLQGSAGLSLAASGSFALATGNTYTGVTAVSGTLTLAHPLAVQNSTVNVSPGGTVNFAAGIVNPTVGGLAGTGGIALATAASESVTLYIGNNNQTTTYVGSLTGPGALTKVGSGMLTLTCASSYTGATIIAAGRLQVTDNLAVGSGPIILAGGTLGLDFVPQGNSIGIHFVGNGSLVTGLSGVAAMSNWDNLSGSSFTSSPLTDCNGNTSPASLTTTNAVETWSSGSSNQLLNGYIYAVSSPLSATISGIPYSKYSLYAYIADSTSGRSEEVTLGGNSYFFGTTNSANYMQITNSTAGSYPTGNYVVANGLFGISQTLTVQGINEPWASLTGIEIVATGGTPSSMTNVVTVSADSTIDMTGISSGSITGLLTVGSNRLCLTGGGTGANTPYSLTLGASGGVSLVGNPTFDVANNGTGAGTLVLGALNDGGTARTMTKTDSGALTLGAAAAALNAGDTVNVNGGTLNSNNAAALGTRTTVNVASGAVFALGAGQTLGALGDSGTVVLNGASVQLNGNMLTVGSGNNLSSMFSGVIADGLGGAGRLVKAGTGAFMLQGRNTYSGGTTISAGTLQAAGTASLPGYSTAGKLTVANGGMFAVSAGGSGWTLANIASLLSSNGSGFAAGSALGIETTAGNFAYGLNIAGKMGVTKLGANTLTLAGSNIYTGPTIVNQGGFVVNGSLVSAVTVNSGGTLGGTGRLSSGTVSAGGAIAPGNSLGTLTFSGGLVLSPGAALDFGLDTPLTSSMISCNSLTLGGQQFFDFSFPYTANFAPGTYYLIESGSAPSGTLGTITSSTIDGYPATLAVEGNNLVLNVVPEPGALGLLGAGVIGLLGWGWRRKRR
jgi:uncharacterized repeat protein (TIGR03803 family)/autotransporter-associated beta strand protein